MKPSGGGGVYAALMRRICATSVGSFRIQLPITIRPPWRVTRTISRATSNGFGANIAPKMLTTRSNELSLRSRRSQASPSWNLRFVSPCATSKIENVEAWPDAQSIDERFTTLPHGRRDPCEVSLFPQRLVWIHRITSRQNMSEAFSGQQLRTKTSVRRSLHPHRDESHGARRECQYAGDVHGRDQAEEPSDEAGQYCSDRVSEIAPESIPAKRRGPFRSGRDVRSRGEERGIHHRGPQAEHDCAHDTAPERRRPSQADHAERYGLQRHSRHDERQPTDAVRHRAGAELTETPGEGIDRLDQTDLSQRQAVCSK